MVLASSYCEPKGEKPATSALWPWIEQPLCRDFLAALLAAYGAGCFSLAYLGEWSAAVGGSIAILVAFGGFALQVTVAGSEGHDIGLAVPAIVLAVIATIAAATLYLSFKTKHAATRSAPSTLLTVFRIFAPILCCVGIALLLGAHAVLPWSLSAQTRLLVGWILIGFAANYAYTSLAGSWAGVRVLLAGLLSYDLVILIPLLLHFGPVEPEYRLTLIINLVVVAMTACLAIFYLFVNTEPAERSPERVRMER